MPRRNYQLQLCTSFPLPRSNVINEKRRSASEKKSPQLEIRQGRENVIPRSSTHFRREMQRLTFQESKQKNVKN